MTGAGRHYCTMPEGQGLEKFAGLDAEFRNRGCEMKGRRDGGFR